MQYTLFDNTFRMLLNIMQYTFVYNLIQRRHISMFGLGSLTRVQNPKCAYSPYRKFNPIENGVYILVEVSF